MQGQVLKPLSFVILAILTLSCGKELPSEPSPSRTFLFGTRPDGEQFVARTSNPEVIKQVLSQLTLPEDERFMFINGKIAGGNNDDNLNWNWHFIEDQWELTDFAIEVCDGRPSMVQSDLDYWLALGQFCPWGSYVIREIPTE